MSCPEYVPTEMEVTTDWRGKIVVKPLGRSRKRNPRDWRKNRLRAQWRIASRKYSEKKRVESR